MSKFMNSFWTDDDIKLLIKLAEIDKLCWKLIARKLKRTYAGVYLKYRKLK